MKNRYFIVLGMSFLAVAASASAQQRNQYDQTLISNFVSSCTDNGGNVELCTCAITEIQKHLTQKEYIDQEQEMMKTGVISEKFGTVINKAVAACLPSK